MGMNLTSADEGQQIEGARQRPPDPRNGLACALNAIQSMKTSLSASINTDKSHRFGGGWTLKKYIATVMIVLLLGSGLPCSATAPSFEGNKDEIIGILVGPDYKCTVGLAIPAGYYVRNATLKVTGMALDGNATAYPENVAIGLNDQVLWEFSKTGYGRLGMQDSFSSGQEQMQISIGAGGGSKNAFIRLPKDAIVQSATIGLLGTAPVKGQELSSYSGARTHDSLGYSVSGAGDMNGDGYDDVIIGMYNIYDETVPDYAYICFGGPEMDGRPNVTLTYGNGYDNFGESVSGAGDVNGDGYDDVIVGAWGAMNLAGRAFIYFGGPNIDSIPDIVLNGGQPYDQFGLRVSGAGDVNGDGYDDVIVGARANDTGGYNAGRAYIFLGGAPMDSNPDLAMSGSADRDYFGYSVSGAGDVNDDGYDDVIVGASAPDNPSTARAEIFFGGHPMDSSPDELIYSIDKSGEGFGFQVSEAGDVNNDGYDDVLIGASENSAAGSQAGRAYLFFGGNNMDNDTDVIFTGAFANDGFGHSVSTAGDVNNDGYDDVIMGAPAQDTTGVNAGRLYLFFGGQDMDNDTDMMYDGKGDYEIFGWSSSDAGDVNGDGCSEIIVGAWGNNSLTGRAYIYTPMGSLLDGVLDPCVAIGHYIIWNASGAFNGTVDLKDFSQALNDCIRSTPTTGTDKYGNSYVDVPLNMTGKSKGNFVLSRLKITYRYDALVPDFALVLNDYTSAHKKQKDAVGNINVPLNIRSISAGQVKLSSLDLTRDSAPALSIDIPTVEIDEDTFDQALLDLHKYFKDDSGSANTLNFTAVAVTNSSFVELSIANRRYLSADAEIGSENDNWTGTVEAKVCCTDKWGQSTESNRFSIIVRNVNDPPEITSAPATFAEPGVPYSYNVTVVHGDKDPLSYRLERSPPDMTIDSKTGVIGWLPRARGFHMVGVIVDDGNATASQDFGISVPNRPPRMTSLPQLNASVGVQYIYNVTAEDPNLDTLHITLGNGPEDMRIDPQSGVVYWTPLETGAFDISITVSDGKERAFQDFTLTVVQGNRAPEFKSGPMTTATVGLRYSYNASATDLDSDVLSYSIESGPEGMTVDAARGKVTWTPNASGDFAVVLKVMDGRGGEARQAFSIEVAQAEKPRVVLAYPQPGRTLRGWVTFSGSVTRGTREVVGVEARIDGGEWNDACGVRNWSYDLNTEQLKNGRHTMELRAYDGKDYSDGLEVNFIVDNTARAKGFIPAAGGPFLTLLFALLVTLSGSIRRTRGASRDEAGR